MGAALRCKRGGPCPPYAKKVAEGMSEEDLHDFASTKDKGLPNRKSGKKMRKAARFDLSHATRTCDMCGTVFGGGATRCPACGHEHMDRLVGGVPTVVGKPVAARVSKSAPRMRPCENCGMMMPRTSKRCSKCGYVNEVRKSQGGSPFQKALAVATPAQKEQALKTLIRVNRAVGEALAKARGRGA
jgi:RNA polymerase subunit RPABC4/transcription elongation factor Spt4